MTALNFTVDMVRQVQIGATGTVRLSMLDALTQLAFTSKPKTTVRSVRFKFKDNVE